MLLQGMEGGWVVIEASHTVRSGLNVTCHMLTHNKTILKSSHTLTLLPPSLAATSLLQL